MLLRGPWRSLGGAPQRRSDFETLGKECLVAKDELLER